MAQKKKRRKHRYNPMKWIIRIVVASLVIFAFTLLINDNGRFVLKPEPKQAYVTVSVDSSVSVHRLHPVSPNIIADSIHIPDFNSLKTKVDSDSVKRYDLYRHQQEVVTIDMEEHKEHVFFTWDDIVAYFDGIVLTFEQLKNKIHNDNH